MVSFSDYAGNLTPYVGQLRKHAHLPAPRLGQACLDCRFGDVVDDELNFRAETNELDDFTELTMKQAEVESQAIFRQELYALNKCFP